MNIDLTETWHIGGVEIPGRARAGADGRGLRAGISPPGPTLRGGPRLLRDGLRVRDPAPERKDARLSAGRLGRAPARDPDLRLRSRGDGRGRSHGRGRRRGHRRHELRLPCEEGDEDRSGRLAPGRPGPRLPARRGGRRRHAAPHLGEDAPGRRERVTHLPGRRPSARRVGRRVAHPASALGEADVHRHRRPLVDGRARLARRRTR